jgi:hypothetical protein
VRADSIAPVHRACLALGACLAFATAACGQADGEHGKATGASNEESCEGRGELVELGMAKQSSDGLVTATVFAASPLPPLQGVNNWTVDVADARVDGGLVLDAFDPPEDGSVPPPEEQDSTVLITIFMVDHDHSLRKRGTMTSPGRFEFPPLTITMTGYWEFSVRVEPDLPADENDHEDVTFGFCVPKN